MNSKVFLFFSLLAWVSKKCSKNCTDNWFLCSCLCPQYSIVLIFLAKDVDGQQCRNCPGSYDCLGCTDSRGSIGCRFCHNCPGSINCNHCSDCGGSIDCRGWPQLIRSLLITVVRRPVTSQVMLISYWNLIQRRNAIQSLGWKVSKGIQVKGWISLNDRLS